MKPKNKELEISKKNKCEKKTTDAAVSTFNIAFNTFVFVFLLFGVYIAYNKYIEHHQHQENIKPKLKKIESNNNLLYEILIKESDWRNIGEQYKLTAFKDLEKFATIENNKIINSFGSIIDININENEMSVLNRGVPSGESCYRVVLGDGFKTMHYYSSGKSSVPMYVKVRGFDKPDWTHYSIGSDIKYGIKKDFDSPDITEIYQSCNNGEETIDIKFYKQKGVKTNVNHIFSVGLNE